MKKASDKAYSLQINRVKPWHKRGVQPAVCASWQPWRHPAGHLRIHDLHFLGGIHPARWAIPSSPRAVLQQRHTPSCGTSAATISRARCTVSVGVTCIGTLLGLALTTTMGYVLSRPVFKMKSFYTWVVFIPMIFNGGMVASYVVNANVLGLKNTIWALILPLAVSSFNIIICKTFFRSTIPDSIIESAKMDGASQLRIFGQIVLPISKPVLATIGLFLVFGYWNDWFQSSLYISDSKLVSLQALLNNMMKSLDYIANNPTAGVSLQQYRNQMPSESVRMAIAIVIVVPIACAYPFFQKYFISGSTIGAVKG